MKTAKISIIIPCYAEYRFRELSELLDSITAQSYKNIETLIITERSQSLTDRIRKYAEENHYQNIRVIQNQEEWGSYSSRNVGIREAKGDILAFVDDDALIFPDWAEETAKSYTANESAIGLTGPILPLWEHESMAWFPKEFYWIFSCTYWEWTEKMPVRNGYGTNISFRKEAFTRCGLFPITLAANEPAKIDWQRPGAKETEFSIRVTHKTGKQIIYDPNIRVKHRVNRYRFSTKFITRRAYWEGYAKALLNRRYRQYNNHVLSTEYKLLFRILFKLVPHSLGLLFKHPIIAIRHLWICGLVLSSVTVGYAAYSLLVTLRPGRKTSRDN